MVSQSLIAGEFEERERERTRERTRERERKEMLSAVR
jgi:hypothetical protein